MKNRTKILGTLVGFLMLALLPLQSRADVWECGLRGNISGVSLGFIFGGQVLDGSGYITCDDKDSGRTASLPVRLTLVGGGVAFDFTIVKSVEIIATGVTTADGPESMTGSFNVGVTAGATLIDRGIDFDSAIKLTNDNNLAFEVGMRGADAIGLGVRLHGMVFVIDPQ